MSKPSDLSPEDLIAFHKATGCPLREARRELMALEPGLRDRVLIASRVAGAIAGELTDPIEQDPVIRRTVRLAAKKAEQLVPGEGMGRCHAIWETQAQILRDEYGIRWYSPAQMNPWNFYD